MKRDKIHDRIWTLHKWLFTNIRAKRKSLSPRFQPFFLSTPVCVPAQERTPKTKWREWNKDPHLTDLSDLISIPCSPTFIYHQPFFPSRNLRFGLRWWRDGSRPRQRQKVYPLAPRPPVASVAPCSPAPCKSHSKPPIIHLYGKGIIIVSVTPDQSPVNRTSTAPRFLEASIQRDEWKGQDNTREMDTGPRWQDKSRDTGAVDSQSFGTVFVMCWLEWIHLPDRLCFRFMEQSLEVRRDESFTLRNTC